MATLRKPKRILFSLDFYQWLSSVSGKQEFDFLDTYFGLKNEENLVAFTERKFLSLMLYLRTQKFDGLRKRVK